jgi:ribosome-associated protein
VSPEQLARRLAELADDKQAVEIVALDMRGLVSYTDFLVICTARNERQAKGIHDEVYANLKAESLLPDHVEGASEARWVLMDYLDCVLHVFVPDERDYYRLETLWGEAPRIELDLAGAAPQAATRGG